MKKKSLSLLLITAMTMSMAGCGQQTSATQGGTDNATVDTQANSATIEDEKWSGTITVWSPQEDQNTGWLSAQCDAFNEAHPEWDITFEYGVCAEGDAKTTVVTDVEGSADVYMLANDNIYDLVASNALAEIGGSYLDYITTTNSESIVSSVTYNDAVVAFPFTSNTWFMYYDKSAYTEEDVKSLETMLEKGKVSFPLSNSWYIQAFYAANGCTLFGDGTDEAAGIDFGGDKATAVTKYLVDLVANPNFINDQDGAGIAGLREGTIDAMFSGTWDASAVQEALGDNMGVAALPTINIDGKDCTMKSFMGSKAIGVNPKSENMQVSMALAAHLASEDAQLDHYETRNILPSNIKLIVDDPIAMAVSQVMQETSIMQPLVPSMSNYWSAAENMGKNIIAGDVTAENAAEKTEEMNKAMNTDVAK